MLEPLEPRGPDGEGVWGDGQVTLGHRRLAIIDLSDAARQPMSSPGGRFQISFNGEIYNYRDLREECGLDPGQLRSTSDTEVLLAAWERWGEECLPRLVGQFAFALYDTRERRLWLVRDRLGEKPLFYHRSNGSFAFASSLRALVRAPWVPSELDDDALAEYLTMRYVVSPRTVLREVSKLPPGHLLRIDASGENLRSWWAPRFSPATERHRRRRRDLAEEFGALLRQACQRCMVSDVPVSLLLSDGIDSNSVLAALRSADVDVPAYTFAPIQGSGGTAPSTSLTEDPNTEVLAIETRRSFEEIEPALSDFTEPVGDGAALATWMLIRNARSRATVFLCGHGADEVLGGYRLSQERFRLALLHWLCRLPVSWFDPIVDRYTYGPLPLEERKRAIVRASASRVPAAANYLIHRPLPLEDLTTLFGSPRYRDGYLASVGRLYDDSANAAWDLDAIQEVLMRTFLCENILSYADSVAMDSSAELRMPYLDRDLVEFVLRLRPPLRASRWPGHANTKQILRHWARSHVARGVVDRKKRTFGYGGIRWMLRQHAGELRARILDAGSLRRRLPALESWLSRPPDSFRGPWEGTFWALLTLALWADRSGVD
jgi:asparagine synthase (glutamine-hydrolysing)